MRRDPARARPQGQGQGQSQRQRRVGEELRHALAWTLEEGNIRDPGLAGHAVTITEVSVSPDLRNATVYCVPLGGGSEAEGEVLAGLRRVKSFLRHRVADRVRLRYVPDLTFVADPSFDAADRIEALLHSPEVARDLAQDDADPEDQTDAEDDPDHGA